MVVEGSLGRASWNSSRNLVYIRTFVLDSLCSTLWALSLTYLYRVNTLHRIISSLSFNVLSWLASFIWNAIVVLLFSLSGESDVHRLLLLIVAKLIDLTGEY